MTNQIDAGNLSSQTCEACQVGAPKIERDEASQLLSQLPEWEIVERHSILQLLRNYQFKNFIEALDFTNRIGALAEQENHHPAVLTEWGKVTLRWWTHKIKGLHKNDFVCAAKSDNIYLQLTSKLSE
ncbi:MAG: 4a-hydroxytetrahydrobiopterin dehydratase [Kangiellaceae bacterium]|nr:4a-hydroxytetrahydrobiopterin dehydratase [Kangiellaceae bacterium]MCW8999034.1 4a-hydroxytetrahydrobiopterin dehydratase [Kangiellaceae bacterium]MCW9016573.1 4a-hydroxytetrahydrobiopterin dehydratase [Kangiellaceae bacterium]